MEHASSRLLRFSSVTTDGGEDSSYYRCENVISQTNFVYCSQKKENVNLVLHWEGDKERQFFCISHFMVKAPVTGFTAPISEGMIFIARDYPDVEKTSKFDGFTYEDYQNFLKKKKEDGEPLTEEDPAAFFCLKTKWCVVQRLSIPRTGRYVHVKLIRASHGDTNIDIEGRFRFTLALSANLSNGIFPPFP